ncbi:MAG: undecaprenyl-diphosphate phosphatase [Planctomycetota bacterium]
MSDAAMTVAIDPPPLDWDEAALYGLIQGVTEFLPVSSSGHLALAHLWGLGHIPPHLALAFDVLLHAATLLAILLAFAPEVVQAVRCGPRFWGVLLIAIVPTGLVALLAEDLVDAAGDRLWVIGLCYLYTATLLLVAEWRSARLAVNDVRRPAEHLASIGWRQALWVGLFQIAALLPGVSRSGSTIAGGLLGRMPPSVAVGFGFLVGLPLMAAAAAKDALDPEAGFAALAESVGYGPLAVAFGVSLTSGVLPILLLKLVVRRRRLNWFAGYCALLGAVCLAIAWLGGGVDPSTGIAP